MAAPKYVPEQTVRATDRSYVGPRRRSGSWHAFRPGDLVDGGGQPCGDLLGRQGPDQGYALSLARRFEARLRLGEGEHLADAVVGCVGVALKRAALFGRAPISEDLEVAFGVFGFLHEPPSQDQLAKRRQLFSGASHHHHYAQVRGIADLVSEGVLSLGAIAARDAFTI